MATRALPRLLSCGMTPLGKHGVSATTLMQRALELAMGKAQITLEDIDGLVAVPSLSDPHFMEAHYVGTKIGFLPQKGVYVKTIDTGGAGPISGLLEACRLVESERCHMVVVVAGDAVSSLSTEEFLKRADQGCQDPYGELSSPVIPNGYDRVAQWQMDVYGTTREQLAIASVLMSIQGTRHPLALTNKIRTVEDVLNSEPIGRVTHLLECARRADGAVAVVVASEEWLRKNKRQGGEVGVIAGGEASGPLYPPKIITETMFSCEDASAQAFKSSNLTTADIDFFGLYDCFPICLIRAIEAVGLAGKGEGGQFLEHIYQNYLESGEEYISPNDFPINTHGGLLAFGAPWEVPAAYNVIEAWQQLRGRAWGRQVDGARRALVYGNGGIFSASAVAILENIGPVSSER